MIPGNLTGLEFRTGIADAGQVAPGDHQRLLDRVLVELATSDWDSG